SGLRVVPGDRHHEPKIRLDQLLLGLFVSLVLAAGELTLLGGRQERAVADRADVELEGILRRRRGLGRLAPVVLVRVLLRGVERTLAARALLAGISERGADAAGFAYRAGSGHVAVHKQRTGASGLLELIEVPAGATQLLVHVRDYTKGHPSLVANNHPIRHG